MTTDNFKQAIIGQFRWNFDGKSLSSEQLAKLSVNQLDLIGKDLASQLPKQESGYSRTYSTSINDTQTEKLKTMLAIVKELADDKDAERIAKEESKQKTSEDLQMLQMLQQLKLQQTQASLSSLTPEQIDAKINSLKTMLKG